MGFRPVSEKPPLSAAEVMLSLSVSAGFCPWYSVESPFPAAADLRDWGEAAFVPHLLHQRSGVATARWGQGTRQTQPTGTIQWGWKTSESQDWALGKGCRDESNYPQGYGHRHGGGSVPGTQAGRIRTLCSGVGLGQSQHENPFCGGILRLSKRSLVAGQEGPEQPQLSSSQFLSKTKCLLPLWLHVQCLTPV